MMQQNEDGTGRLQEIVRALQDPRCFDHPVDAFEVLETHISMILLTGPFAYKFKKPVHLDFVDFSRIGLRGQTCRDEVRLNRRLAPGIYEGVTAIYGTPQSPRLKGSGQPIEFAVKMKQFPQEALLKYQLARGAVGRTHIEALARTLARFHDEAPAHTETAAERAGVVEKRTRECLDSLPGIEGVDTGVLERLGHWVDDRIEALGPVFTTRVRDGRVREGHGDLHAGNLVLIDDELVAFDCLEFDRDLRTVDVMNDLAFLSMDLEHGGRADLAHSLVNAYLSAAGDYAGLVVLRFFGVYRALVRAKVAALTSKQVQRPAERREELETLDTYLKLAVHYTRPARRRLLILTYGLSASGKSTVADSLVPATGVVVVRSDVERKRLGFGRAERYGEAATAKTYQRLADGVRDALKAGFPVIADATFLDRARRDDFSKLASALGAEAVILETRAPDAVLDARAERRAECPDSVSEADTAVLEHQRQTFDHLTPEERARTVTVDTSARPDPRALARDLRLETAPYGTKR